jgi:hypothetical protein
VKLDPAQHFENIPLDLPIVKHEAKVIMNLKNISRVVGGEDSYTYSLLVRAILHLHVGIISLPLLRSIYNVFLRRDIHPYKVPSKYT